MLKLNFFLEFACTALILFILLVIISDKSPFILNANPNSNYPKIGRFFAGIVVLIESGFPLENRNMFQDPFIQSANANAESGANEKAAFAEERS